MVSQTRTEMVIGLALPGAPKLRKTFHGGAEYPCLQPLWLGRRQSPPRHGMVLVPGIAEHYPILCMSVGHLLGSIKLYYFSIVEDTFSSFSVSLYIPFVL